MFFSAAVFAVLAGCGGGGSSGGAADISHLNQMSSNFTQASLSIGGVVSGKSGPFSAPSKVFSEPGLRVTLVSAEKEQTFPLMSDNTFLLSGIPRSSDHYIIRIYNQSGMIADYPIDLEGFTGNNDLVMLDKVTLDKEDTRIVVARMVKTNLGSNPSFMRQLFERGTAGKVTTLDFSNLNLGSYPELLYNGVIDYYEETDPILYTLPDDFFQEMILHRNLDGEQHTLAMDDTVGSDDPFYDPSGTILSNLTIGDANTSAQTLKVMMGTAKNQNSAQISLSSEFYATLVFYDVDDNHVTPDCFFLKIKAESTNSWIEKSAYFVRGTAYREDGTSIGSITNGEGNYYLYYGSLSQFGMTTAQKVTFTIDCTLPDANMIRTVLSRDFIP